MKKSLIIILVVGVVAVGGIVFFSVKSRPGEEITPPSQTTEKTTVTEETMPVEETTTVPKGAAAGSLASLGDSYQCTYTIENNIKVTTYVKNGKMRTEIPVSGDNANVALYADDKVYQWSTKDKQGVFMTVAAAKQQAGTEVQDPQEYLNAIMTKYQPDCKKINLADSLFVAPKDIQFQDLSQLLNQ